MVRHPVVDFHWVQTITHWRTDVKMLRAMETRKQRPTPYATGSDFCRIFREDTNRLYLLAFLLTADHAMAEKCFVRGLDDSIKGNPVFKEWAQSWARRAIIQNAIRMLQPRPGPDRAAGSLSNNRASTEPVEIAGVVELPAFERFAFVMSVLERYSEKECSLLLGCTRADVVAARISALEKIGSSVELRNKLVSITSAGQTSLDNARSELQLEPISQLAVPA